MPELPEVETIVRGLRKNILNTKIKKIEINYSKIIETHSTDDFISILINKQITEINRRAKYIVFELSNQYSLILHLRMTGKVLIKTKNDIPTKHDHIIIHLDNNICLFYNDTRKFGRFYLTNNRKLILGKLGPEPFGKNFIFSEFSQNLSKTQRKIKALLLDQSFVAGLGNIYTDEALWEARIHPEQSANNISQNKQKALFEAIKNVLQKGIENQGTSLGDGQGNYASSENNRGNNQNSLMVFAKTGEPCPNCENPIQKIVVAQRGTHFCPSCQKLKK